jgi:NitT/TauT family transport system permease protein
MSGLVVVPGYTRRFARQAGDWIPALVVFVAGIAAWEGAIVAFDIQKFLLPKPSDIALSCWDQRGTLWPAGWYTFREALGGFVIGSVGGMAVATVVGRFRSLGTALMPIAIAANAIPIIAFAPIFNAWFDPLSPNSKIAIAAVLCFFPVMVNTLRGLTSVSPRQIELMRSYAASELTVWRRVRVPTALPYVFTALKVASVLAMIGAVVGEYFGGSYDALGVLIRSKAQILDFETAWAGILVASVLGIVLYLAVSISERVLVRWSPDLRDS